MGRVYDWCPEVHWEFVKRFAKKEKDRNTERSRSLSTRRFAHPLGQTRRLRNDSATNQIREFPERRAETSIFRSVIKAVIVNRKERNSEKIKSLPANCGSKRQKANMCVHIYVYITHTHIYIYTYTRALKRKMQAKAAWAGGAIVAAGHYSKQREKKKKRKNHMSENEQVYKRTGTSISVWKKYTWQYRGDRRFVSRCIADLCYNREVTTLSTSLQCVNTCLLRIYPKWTFALRSW